jgi:hypothetical protein
MGRSAPFARAGALALAAVVGLQALWFLAAAIVRPRLPFFPADRQSAEAVSTHRSRAAAAASIGMVRADLWTDYALTLAAAPLLAAAPVAADPCARKATERAAAFGPHDARSWLLLAGILERAEMGDGSLAGPLKMSYYTGPNEAALIPFRLKLATRSSAIADAQVQTLVASELRTIVLRRSDLKPAVLAAYRQASPQGRRLIEDTVTRLDPAFGGELRAGARS